MAGSDLPSNELALAAEWGWAWGGARMEVAGGGEGEADGDLEGKHCQGLAMAWDRAGQGIQPAASTGENRAQGGVS